MKYTAVYFDPKSRKLSHATTVGAAGPGVDVILHKGPLPAALGDCFVAPDGTVQRRAAIAAAFDEAHGSPADPLAAFLVADGEDLAVLSGLPVPCEVRGEEDEAWTVIDDGQLALAMAVEDDYELHVRAAGYLDTVFRIQGVDPAAKDSLPANAAGIRVARVLTRNLAALQQDAVLALRKETARQEKAIVEEMGGLHALEREEAARVLDGRETSREVETPALDAECAACGKKREQYASEVMAREDKARARRTELLRQHAEARRLIPKMNAREARRLITEASGSPAP